MKKLGQAGVDSPRRDALVLLEDTLGKDRAWVLAHADYKPSEKELTEVNTLIERRINREPLAYIRSKAWFYGRFFAVSSDTLIPRPESEDFIDIVKKLQPKTVVDIGTGSGALAITTKLELPDTEVVATDIDKKALVVATQNAKQHQADVAFAQGSLLAPIGQMGLKDYTVLANLPYVPDSLVTSPEIETEPKLALFSGTDGMDHYKKFWLQAKELPTKPTNIIVESLQSQHQANNKLAKDAGYKLVKTTRLIQTFVG